jgi:hypothetical protein
MNLGTLAVGLGSFPLADGPYHPPTDSRILTLYGIQRLAGFGNLVRPLAQSVLYPR